MARPGIVVQARVGSTRLPGKVLLRTQGDTLLGHLLRRLQRCGSVSVLVVATTEKPEDGAVVDEARGHGAATFRGSENDVLSRYLGAARALCLDPVVRITSDCPIADPAVVDRALERYAALRDSPAPVDLVTNGRPGARTYPRGLDVEVVRLGALEEADARMGPEAEEREHVTQYLYRHPESFRYDDLKLPLDLSFLRFTVDTREDFELVREIYDELFPVRPDFDLHDVLALLARRPELLAINAHVRQKAG